MPTRRRNHLTPYRASFAAPLIAMSQVAALSATAMLANFGWTSAYRPDPVHMRYSRDRDHPTTTAPCGSPEPGDERAADPTGGAPDPACTAGSGALPSAAGQPAARSPAVDHTISSTTGGAADDGDETTDGEETDDTVAHAADGVDEETATARWFVTAALDGDLGDAHQQAARTAVAVATEHGFVDDPTRVAEALVVFLHPDHR